MMQSKRVCFETFGLWRILLLMVFCSMISTLFAATETVDGVTYIYTVVDGKASIYNSDNEKPRRIVSPLSSMMRFEPPRPAISSNTIGALKIPSVLGGYPVTTIGKDAVNGCSKLTSVIIPNSVTSIGHSAFCGCSGLTVITIPDSVITVDEYAFCWCNGLTSLIIGNNVASISSSTFQSCSGLTSITIPNSVTSINIDGVAFAGCSALQAFHVDSKNPNYSSKGGVLFNKTGSALLAYPAGVRGGYVIPDNVATIGHSAFNGCKELTSITIPSSVTTIEARAFENCTGLTSLVIPDSVTSIETQAFSGCSGLTSLSIGNGVTSIGHRSFAHCTGLTSITIPDSVTSIDSYAFHGCGGLTSIPTPKNAPAANAPSSN